MRIRVEDGVIVFPYDSIGRTASAQGVFQAVELGAKDDKHKNAKDEHAECAAGAHKKGNVIYQIAGTGAVIN